VGVNVSGTLKLPPGANVGGVVIGVASVKGPEVLIELMVPLALPELVTLRIKLLLLPTAAPGNVIVPPGVTVVVGCPVIKT
jgi:hypothetical protein